METPVEMTKGRAPTASESSRGRGNLYCDASLGESVRF
jgi:hypothetical protein